MSIKNPFHRNYRGFITNANSGYSSWVYVTHPDYATSPEHYVRAFKIIQNDLIKIFDFVEPSDTNLHTYSYRIHEILMRACIEIEANFKAIFKENIFTPLDKKGKIRKEESWNIIDYKKINTTHHLSSYKVYIPIWKGSNTILTPFAEWNTSDSLTWYQAYNKSKHDRHNSFQEANLKNALNAVAGLLVLISSQFGKHSFSSGNTLLALEDGNSKMQGSAAIGSFFRIDFPNDWLDSEKYDFNWRTLEKEALIFHKIDFNSIS